ncbi:hypothetical protein WG924_12030 [Tistrella sp. 25B02-3]
MATGILSVDAADDVGFFGDDLSPPPNGPSAIVKGGVDPVAIGEAGGDAALGGDAAMTAAHLVGEVAQKQRIHRALQADV